MSMLSLLEQPSVPWARKGRYGEGGSFGLQIDASGLELRNRVMHRELVPATAEVSLHTRVRMRSTLVASANGFEGFAVRHRGFQLEGAAPAKTDRQVWDSNPQGLSSWISAQLPGFTTRSFLVAPPTDRGIDYVTWEALVRASSGQVTLSTIECRHAFTRPLVGVRRTELAEYSGAGLSRQPMVNEFINWDGVDYSVVYVGSAESISLSRGQILTLQVNGSTLSGNTAAFSGGDSPPRAAARVGIFAKLRQTNGNGAHYQIAEVFPPVEGFALYGAQPFEARAPADFDQIEYLVGVQPYDSAIYSDPRLGIQSLFIDGHISDFVAPSQ